LIGGHGIDVMHGGEGDDWLRGDTNRDELTGGAGSDTASFMTATPPGQPLGDLPARSGVIVDNRVITTGWASGDGYREALAGVETIIGSAFDDALLGGARLEGGYGDDRLEGAPALEGGPGDDTCGASPCADGEPATPGDRALVFLAPHPRDLGLAAIGSAGDDALVILLEGGVAVVRSENGAPLDAGHGCTSSADGLAARCVLTAELRYVVGYGGDGADRLRLEGAFPRDLSVTLDGGSGDDVLTGHRGEDILFAGASGLDTLEGLGGDDALLSESTDADTMRAGGGNDQLVANYPCGGHLFEGGGGIDVGGFARVGTSFDTAAERHRQRIHAQLGHRAYQPAFCARDAGTRLGDDIEILEGAGGDDELIGNDADNTLWGWGGDDVMRGLGGDDTIEGHQGNDQLYGGAGRDRLRGGAGYDVLYASDGERDPELSCGGDRGRVASRDPIDPGAEACD
jgi:Ca2+-binding RTX toxin-like protein